MSKAEPLTFAELQTVTSLGRGEIRECANRGIISAPVGVGQGTIALIKNWDLVEDVSQRRCCNTFAPASSPP